MTGILAGLEDGDILLETAAGIRRIPRKAAALVKPVVDMEGIEEVDFSENTESGENER
jgi:ribosome maturation factor RimP